MACAACAAEHEQAYRTASRSELEQSHEFRQIAYLQAVGGPSTTVGGSDPTVNGRISSSLRRGYLQEPRMLQLETEGAV